jgi:hypothetical protein
MTIRYRNLGLLKVRARFIQSCNLSFACVFLIVSNIRIMHLCSMCNGLLYRYYIIYHDVKIRYVG